MEVQLAVKGGRSAGSSTPPHRHGDAKPVPNYLRPSAGSCHHVCKYGGTHTFEEKDEPKAQPRPRKPPPVSDTRKMAVIKARSVSRRRVGDSSRAEKAAKAAIDKERELERVEWKDILAYDAVPDNIMAEVTGLGDPEKKDLMKGKKSYGKARVPEQVDGFKSENESLDKKLAKSVRSKRTRRISTEPQASNKEASPPHNNTITDAKSAKPPKGKKPTALLIEKQAIDQEMVHGYQILSPSLIQSRANLLCDLEKEMVQEAAYVKEGKTTNSLDQEELAATESSRPIPVHRRVKSMSISSRSVHLPFIRQASKNSAAFKLHSSSTKAPILPSEEEKPRMLRSRRGSVAGEDSSSTGRGIQLRIRSLRRRGVGGSGGASAGFVVPAVTLRHQKTLEKKKSQRLYNNLIEETASKLVKTRKSRVKALVGAFETVISKIRK